MLSPALKRKALKAGRLYLEMRGYELIEQNWGMGRHKFDLIVSRGSTVSFIDLFYEADLIPSSSASLLTSSDVQRITAGLEAWIEDAKYRGKYSYSRLELGGPEFSILNFNENII